MELSADYPLPDHPKILVCRTDNLGDVVLTLPLCGMIKQLWPSSTLSFVGKPYTKPIIDACQWIDQFWDRSEIINQTEDWKAASFDLVIYVFPDRELAFAISKKKIKARVGTSHRWWHWLTCNIRPSFTRKNSDLHEAQLNIELLKPFLNNALTPSNEELGKLFGFRQSPNLQNIEVPYIVLHPKSSGSAREWPIENYHALAHQLVKKGYKVLFTGTTKEGEQVLTELPNLFDLERIESGFGKYTLAELITVLGGASYVIACSTGPLHIASALGVHVIGIYPPLRPMHPGRWAPIGKNATVLVLNKNCEECRVTQDCACIKQIEVMSVINAMND